MNAAIASERLHLQPRSHCAVCTARTATLGKGTIPIGIDHARSANEVSGGQECASSDHSARPSGA